MPAYVEVFGGVKTVVEHDAVTVEAGFASFEAAVAVDDPSYVAEAGFEPVELV